MPLDARARAAVAHLDVTERFGRRLLGLPGTHLGRTTDTTDLGPRSLGREWNYWWQAHYLDALVDAALRDPTSTAAATAWQVLRTVRLRNAMRFHNSYFDDMGWLALATWRLRELGPATHRRLTDSAGRAIRPRLESADTDDLGGGLFWNTARDFKNIPASAPAAVLFARVGDTRRADDLIQWCYDSLFDADLGLFLDGLRITPSGVTREAAIYTYNQGTMLGALVARPTEDNLERAAELIDAISVRLARPDPGCGGQPSTGRVLITHGGGDGGLFTGILVRYLGLAALEPRLPGRARTTATRLVDATAEAFWRSRPPGQPGTGTYAVDPLGAGAPGAAAGVPVELSTQVQAWMVLEAAARLH